jgi:hypothetical protein
MDLRRVRGWDWATGLAGLVLFASLFLDWYGVDTHGEPVSGHTTLNAWQAFSVRDIVLAIAALLAIAYFVVAATQRTAAVPQATASAFVVPAGVVAAILALLALFFEPGLEPFGVHPGASGGTIGPPAVTREIGLWIGTLAALCLFGFGWKAMRDKRFPDAMRPKLEVQRQPAPTPEGERREAT